MDEGRRKMNSVARRTRSRWFEYFQNCYNELKRKDPESGGGDGGRGKRARDLVQYENKVEDDFVVSGENGGSRDAAGEMEKDSNVGFVFGDGKKLDARVNINDGNGVLKIDGVGILKKDEREDDNGVEIMNSDEDNGVETLRRDGDHDDDNGVESLKSYEADEGNGVEILMSDEDEGNDVEMLETDGDDEDGIEILKSDEVEDNGIEMLKIDVDGIEILKSDGDEDNVVEMLENEEDDDDGIEILKSDEVEDIGIEMLKNDEDDDDGIEILKSDEDEDNEVEMLNSAEDDGIESLKSDEDEDNGLEMLESDENEDNGVEMLGSDEDDESLTSDENEDNDVETLESDADDDDGIESSKSAENEDNGVEMLKSDGEEDDDNSGECSGGKAQIEPLDGEQIYRSISVDSDRPSIDSRNSTEDSDESVGLEVSESEPYREEDDEVLDEDYKGDESSDDTYHDSGDELVNDDEYGVGENENLMKGAEENLSDTVEDANGVSTGKNLRNESDTEQEKDDESEEGCNVRSSDCNIRSNQQKSGDGISINDKEKLSRVMKSKRVNTGKGSGDELARDDKIDKEKKKLPGIKQSARKSRKGDGEEEPNSVSKSQKKEPEKLRKCSSPVPNKSCMDSEHKSLSDVGNHIFTRVKTEGERCSVKKVEFSTKNSHSARNIDLIKILVDSINSVKQKQYTIDENALAANALPLRFRFEDEVVPPPEKSEWEKHIDALFCDLELGLRETETNCTSFSTAENDDLKNTEKIDESQAASCRRGDHHSILDEQIGIFCDFCHTVIMDIKHVLPEFHIPTRDSRRDRRYRYYDESPWSFFSDIQFQGSASTTHDSTSCTKGTVWDLIPGVKQELYPHQREGFEFMWKNIAGDTIIKNLKQTLADDARGCIISHAPGTGKTRLTIVFLQTFLKLYPTCCPMIIAPLGMLLTWEAEFRKWNCNAAFHNLNKNELSGKENAVATELLGQVGSGVLSTDCIRLLKLYSWTTGGSVLGISYPLFGMLAGGNGKRQQHEKMKEVLLERPGLVVLDEGHTPRNDKGKLWNALTKVSTQQRIILSGTPFQNTLQELYNTLCVVNPKLANQVGHQSCKTRQKLRNLTSSRGIVNRGNALKLRAMIDPFVHVYKGTILDESLPGLRHTLLFLHPTECQKTLLVSASKEQNFLCRTRMISLIAVHPSIREVMERYPGHHRKLEGIKLDIEAGVKAMFLMKLIRFCDALGERVLVFSQFLGSLVFMKEQLECMFSWNEGREVLYMDGQLDDKRRQDSISTFNDEASEAKVLLASVRACSEGINLIGASRVVLLDTVWNPSVEKQAICRAYRLGQKKVVHVYRLFTSGVEVRLKQYDRQVYKKRISQWLFSFGEGQGRQSDKSGAISDDRVLEAMLNLDKFNHIFDKIISEPKESDLIKTFGLEEHN